MKINSNSKGNIVIQNNQDEILHIISDNVFLHLHSIKENVILISKEASRYKAKSSIQLDSNEVTEVEGVAFSGTRNELLLLLSTLFQRVNNDSNIAKLEELNLKLQEIIDKPDFETVLTIGIDSDSLEGIVYDAVTSETYGVGGGTVPTIVQEEQTPNIVEWTSVSNSHRLVIPFNYAFQAENMSLYFEFETLATNIDQNRYYFYFQKMDGGTPTTILSVSSDTFRLGRSNGNKQIIELKYDNSVTNYQDFRVLVQPFASNVNYPATYQLKALGVLPSNFSYHNLVKELLTIENNIPVGATYLGIDNSPKNLTGVFLPTSNFPSENTLKETLTTICENLVKSNYEKIVVANDYTQTTSYLDEGNATDRRIHTIVHASTLLGLTITETYVYGGVAGGYYLTSITRT
ncbi:hypothetical protein [Aureispira sp. CCB-E]|uniref:hypothetical protein n=1 Tax=Aureispira sp. CCB-E TaxID=3051121 RepID=UPI002868A454|nr:hypothetical protein [Aureispira sp. CCB-E]WMX12392.1 hypothetical protein QP953_16305 [Aureispira sp. CCB-E]